MAKESAKLGTDRSESLLHTFDGVAVYARRDDRGRPMTVDAIDQDQEKIESIADRLWRSGFGVMHSTTRVPARCFTCSRRHGRVLATRRRSTR